MQESDSITFYFTTLRAFNLSEASMQLHNLQPNNSAKSKKRVGRGGKRGKTAGRGTKGQKSRSGRRIRPEARDFIKKIPKLRGYRFKSSFSYAVANVGDLDKRFNDGGKVNPAILLKYRLISKISGKLPKVKILGEGEISKKLSISGCKVSASAKSKIEKAGGTVS